MEEILIKIFMSALDLEESELFDELSLNSIETWDSLTHLMMMAEIEKTFNIEFEEDKIPSFNTIKKIKNEWKKLLC